MKALNYIFR